MCRTNSCTRVRSGGGEEMGGMRVVWIYGKQTGLASINYINRLSQDNANKVVIGRIKVLELLSLDHRLMNGSIESLLLIIYVLWYWMGFGVMANSLDRIIVGTELRLEVKSLRGRIFAC